MKNIVTVGGGTGSYAVLSGLKQLPNISLTAIVSMADNGGSTGILMDELGILPSGDVRQSLAALSESSETVRELINYRFTEGSLSGHSFGNIFLAALEKVTGDFAKGVVIASEILKVKGAVIPVTRDKAKLFALLSDGNLVVGESKIDESKIKESGVAIEKIFYKNEVRLSANAKKAIAEADYIIICPGDFYTSIAPNLIVEGFKEALMESEAKIIAIENLGNDDKEGYQKKLEFYLGKRVDKLISADKSLMSDKIILKNPADKVKRSTLRHDPLKLADIIKNIIN